MQNGDLNSHPSREEYLKTKAAYLEGATRKAEALRELLSAQGYDVTLYPDGWRDGDSFHFEVRF